MMSRVASLVSAVVVVVVVALALATAARAQTIADPTTVEFDSPDHSATAVDGASLVQSYRLTVYVAGVTSATATAALGKPPLGADGKVRVAFVALLSAPLTKGVVYEARVTAVGPGGSTDSAPTNTFYFSPTTPPPPAETCNGPATGAFTGCYYAGMFGALLKARTDPTIAFDWGTGSPDPAVPADVFSARWEGVFAFDAGTYAFMASTDDGVRVAVDGALVIDQWVDRAATTDTVSVVLAAGQHAVRVEYYENGGEANASVRWLLSPPTQPPPVDCVVSDWTCGAWGACDGAQTRTCTRTALTPASDGGTACPALTTTETQACVPGDVAAPVVTSLVVSQNGRSKNYTVSARATDGVGVTRASLSVDGRAPVPMVLQSTGAWTATFSVATAGTHTVTARASDAAGNTGEATRTFVR